jgi:expansin (peptidoglycan-binding protein)
VFAQPTTPGATINDANSPNRYGGAGSTMILSGQFVNPNNTFSSSFTASNAAPVPLNQHAGGSGSYAGINTITGSGSTGGALVMVNSVMTNYFLTALGAPLVMVNFTSISSGVPFTAVDPAMTMFNGTTPNIGTVNGSPNNGGPDFLTQTQTNNNFAVSAVPEPASVTLALIGAGLAGWRLRRQHAPRQARDQ